MSVLEEVVESVGLCPDGLESRLNDPATKLLLRESTEAAIEQGVFGVPMFSLDGELFWGHDRMEALAARLAGDLDDTEERARLMLARPRAVKRKQ